jgi:hypothetical protein
MCSGHGTPHFSLTAQLLLLLHGLWLRSNLECCLQLLKVETPPTPPHGTAALTLVLLLLLLQCRLTCVPMLPAALCAESLALLGHHY